MSQRRTPSGRPRDASPPNSGAVWARIGSAFAAFVTGLALLWLGTPALVPLFLALSGIGVYEYAAMLRLRGVRVNRTILIVMTVLTVPAALPAGHPLAPTGWLPFPPREALLMSLVLILLGIATRQPRRDALATVVYTLLGYLWIPGFFSYLLTLREFPDPVLGLATVLLPTLAVVASDVGGWVFGRAFGRRPLSPDLSPDKTVEGAIGGLVLAAAVTPVAAALLHAGPGAPLPTWVALGFGVVIAAVAQIGDLFESLVKRWAGVKDAGLFLPGQGGVLDRIDSHLFALPVAYLLLSFVGQV